MHLPFSSIAAILGLASKALAACNGHDEYCSRLYSNMTFIGSHDSAFVGPLPTENQFLHVGDQLNFGVRFLQAQTHMEDSGIEMCHTSCLELNAGSLQAYLTPIKAFMDANPDEVVTLLLTNQDAIPVSQFADVFHMVGLDEYVFTPSGQLSLDQWPTMQQMIDANTRLVVWMDYHADTSVVPWILDEFEYFWETAYDVTDKSFPSCAVDRPPGASTDGRMALVNHMLHIQIFDIQMPNAAESFMTNSQNSIHAQAALCECDYGTVPNVILVDFVNMGDAMGAQMTINNV